MFKDIKIDFPAVLALNIFITFAIVIMLAFFVKIPVDGPLGQLIEVLKNIVLIMVGFYFGSSAGSKSKDDALIKNAAPPTPEVKP